MGYTHPTVHERHQIFSLMKAGCTAIFVARQLGRHPLRIYREVKCNLVFDPQRNGYSPSRAHALARSIAESLYGKFDFI